MWDASIKIKLRPIPLKAHPTRVVQHPFPGAGLIFNSDLLKVMRSYFRRIFRGLPDSLNK